MTRLATMLALALLLCAASSSAQPPERPLVESLRAVYQLQNYTAFDWISGAYEKGVITLRGMVRTPQLKTQAGAAVRDVEGVEDVVNDIDVLPTHAGDDEVRVAVYAAIYGRGALERYAPGGQLSAAAIRELADTARFGLEGSDVGRGPHAIHILVSGGRVLLRGQVRTTGDRQIAAAAARTTPGVLSVTNELRVPDQR